MTKKAAILKGYLTFAGAAKHVGTDPAAVSRAVASGTLPYVVTECGKARLIKREDVEAWHERSSWENRRIAEKTPKRSTPRPPAKPRKGGSK